jgi:hypothetical protein
MGDDWRSLVPTDPETVLITSLRGLVTRLENLESQVASSPGTWSTQSSACAKELAGARACVVNALRLLNRQRYP